MKQQSQLFHNGLSRTLFLLFLLFLPLMTQAETVTKTYEFSSFQYQYDASVKSAAIIVNGDIWSLETEVEPTADNGLYVKGVNSLRLQLQKMISNITNITVRAAAAPNANSASGDFFVYITVNSGSSDFMTVTSQNEYQNTSSSMNVTPYSYDFEKTETYPSVGFLCYGDAYGDFLIKEISVTYEEGTTEDEGGEDEQRVYDLWIDGMEVTTENMSDVKGDGTVAFDGNRRLILNNASLREVAYNLPELEVYLIGENMMENQSYPFEAVGRHDKEEEKSSLTFSTNCNNPGTFSYFNFSGSLSSFDDAFPNIAVTLRDNLAGEFHDEENMDMIAIAVPLLPIVDDIPDTPTGTVTYVDYGTDAGEVSSASLLNFVYKNVLYTLNDTQTPNVPDDGFAEGKVVLNSTMTDAEVAALNKKVNDLELLPGTESYAAAFKGLTFVVPAGTGFVVLNTETPSGFEFHVKIGGQDAVPVVNKADNNGNNYAIPYSVSTATYVYLYLTGNAAAPAMREGLRPIGPKSTVSGGLGGLGVSGSNITDPGTPSSNYLLCTSDMFKYSATGGIIVDNADVTDIDASTFFDLVSAPRRALGDFDIPFIDLSQTSIIGKDVSRLEGAFEGFSEQTLIYMPTGNTSAEPNVIIGDVCDNLVLEGNNTKTFAMPDAFDSFIAAKASYLLGMDGVRTDFICLPYAIGLLPEGTVLYDYDSFDSTTGTVKLKAVSADATENNNPYIFSSEYAFGGLPEATNVQVVNQKKRANPFSTTEADGLHGVYQFYAWGSSDATTDVYGLQGSSDKLVFEPFVGKNRLYAFQGYLRLSSAPTTLEIDWSNGQTSIIPLDASQVRQNADGWYTITGLRLPSKPTQKGLYIHHSKKVTIP